jgi:hypothetical protein
VLVNKNFRGTDHVVLIWDRERSQRQVARSGFSPAFPKYKSRTLQPH